MCVCVQSVCVFVWVVEKSVKVWVQKCAIRVCVYPNAHILLPIVVFAIKKGTKTHTYLERK